MSNQLLPFNMNINDGKERLKLDVSYILSRKQLNQLCKFVPCMTSEKDIFYLTVTFRFITYLSSSPVHWKQKIYSRLVQFNVLGEKSWKGMCQKHSKVLQLDFCVVSSRSGVQDFRSWQQYKERTTLNIVRQWRF